MHKHNPKKFKPIIIAVVAYDNERSIDTINW